LLLLLLLGDVAIANIHRPHHHHGSFATRRKDLALVLRGGSTTTTTSSSKEAAAGDNSKEIAAENRYRMDQLFLLQSRSMHLREALVKRGLIKEVGALNTADTPQLVDWDCAMSTTKDPKSCLYSFDAEPDTKVLAPIDTTQWISMGSLNRLRRADPTKVEPMWHNKFAIHQSWFKTGSPYSISPHLPLEGKVLSLLLDGPIVLNLLIAAVAGVLFLITRPILEVVVVRIATSFLLWNSWPRWARFVHAPLPFKLLITQLAFRMVAGVYLKMLQLLREQLIQMECRVLEDSIPLTIVEDDGDDYDDEEES